MKMQGIEILQPEQALDRDWDLIIAGSSFASMFFINGLPDDLNVLIVEAGPIKPHSELTEDRRGHEHPVTMVNLSGKAKTWFSSRLFGGNSNCWWGNTPRFHPTDFELQSRYGVGEDWPLGYDDLEPFYAEVEDLMEIAGGGTDHILPRSRPFPHPPHALTRTDRVMAQTDPSWVPVSSARSNGGSRATCCSNGVCHRCPVDAKFTILNGLDRLVRPNVALIADCELRRLTIENRTATAAEITDRAGQAHRLSARLFALGTNPIFNSAILLRSGVTAPGLGQYLHEQAGRTLVLDIDHDNLFGGTSITGHGYALYDGPHRSKRAAVLMENFNVPMPIRPEPGRWTQTMVLRLVAEDLPQSRNSITLKDGEPLITWHGHSDYAYAGLDHARQVLPDLLPFEVENIAADQLATTEYHIQGGHRMGEAPESSVTNAALRTHEVGNLFALGAGSFVSCSAANPTLTLAALSLRAGRLVQ